MEWALFPSKRLSALFVALLVHLLAGLTGLAGLARLALLTLLALLALLAALALLLARLLAGLRLVLMPLLLILLARLILVRHVLSSVGGVTPAFFQPVPGVIVPQKSRSSKGFLVTCALDQGTGVPAFAP